MSEFKQLQNLISPQPWYYENNNIYDCLDNIIFANCKECDARFVILLQDHYDPESKEIDDDEYDEIERMEEEYC